MLTQAAKDKVREYIKVEKGGDFARMISYLIQEKVIDSKDDEKLYSDLQTEFNMLMNEVADERRTEKDLEENFFGEGNSLS